MLANALAEHIQSLIDNDVKSVWLSKMFPPPSFQGFWAALDLKTKPQLLKQGLDISYVLWKFWMTVVKIQKDRQNIRKFKSGK